ncbi:hypothetical protein DAPPUDRAFT_93942 [Daphnia pulex]|uniref:GDNF/GAS1 domain-containing protein n=1 Tax=Daphnia pulex TaxID=6669 RepID=E9FRQ2_DAPPU|nr:hypothetical protein DAPPUDRAFT_93942 [Daphnia pulex]|eukprot:EFX90446.1 hypothetical protein DAPPUDRAFT_93942 [Daphnia pulex]
MRWVTAADRTILLWTLLLLSLAATLVLASHESHAGNRRGNGSKGRKRNGGRSTTSTTTTAPTAPTLPLEFLNETSSSSFFDGDDEVDVEAAAAQHQQDQPPGGVETCEVARLKCAYRVGCGMALQNYMVGCSDVITGSSQRCSDHCRNSLIALTSTEEGEALMKCKCGDTFCKDAKRRIDICRSAVLRATHNSTTVSCSVAQWICIADPLCSTALEYYNRFCRSMFAGKKCTLRCKNSISILRRQEKAAKLSTCVCDGSEDYDCPSILDNMDRLCFHKERSSSTTTAATISHHQHTTITAEGGGLGVEERNDTSSNSGGIGDRDRTGHGHGSGHHPGHQPHGAKTRPHHPHHPEATAAALPDAQDIETNEVEIRPSPSPPTARSPSRASSSLASASAPYCWLLLSAVFSLSGRLLL